VTNKNDGFEGYRVDILNDLKTISPYLKNEYIEILNDVYNREEVEKGVISFSLLSHDELCKLIHKELNFKELNTVFEHEIN
jgi:hypothetical protein